MDISAFFKPKKIVGLDIGSNTIKMAELDIGRNGAQLVSFGFIPTPIGAVGAGEITNSSALSEAIKVLHAQIKSKTKNICVGMWGTSVIVKKITMPKIEKKLVSQQIKWEAEQYIPFDVNDISLVHSIITSSASPDTMDVLLIAAQNAIVSQYAQAIAGAGLKLDVLDVSGFALANSFELNHGKVPGQTVALLNVGASTTNLVVLHNGEVIFSRDIPFGGASYTNEISKEMGVTIQEAEALKLSGCTGHEVPEQVHHILNSTTELIAEEVRNSFDFFSASAVGFSVVHCFFTGGASATPNLISRISQVLGIQFEPMNTFARIKPAKNMDANYIHQIGPFAAVVLGLASRKLGD